MKHQIKMKILPNFLILIFVFLKIDSCMAKIKKLEEFFLEEEKLAKTVDFRVLKAKASFNFVGGFADGEYKLSNSTITHYKGHIYVLRFEFYKKKGIPKFGQKLTYPFWYNGKILVFKTPKGKVKFEIPQKYKIRIKHFRDGSYEIEKIPMFYKITLPAINGKVELTIGF